MIEATSAVTLNAPVLRQLSEGMSSNSSYAANPEGLQRVSQAPFISPFISVDTEFNTAVIQLRNPTTGEVVEQIPDENKLKRDRYLDKQAEKTSERETDSRSQDPVTFDSTGAPASDTTSHTELPSVNIEISSSDASTGDSAGSRGGSVSLLA